MGVGWNCGVELQLLVMNATDNDSSEERKSQGFFFSFNNIYSCISAMDSKLSVPGELLAVEANGLGGLVYFTSENSSGLPSIENHL